VYCLGINSVDEKLVVSGGGDDRSHVWDISTGQKLWSLDAHDDSVVATGFSFDGKYVASAGLDQVVKVFDVKRKQLVNVLEGPSEDIEFMIWDQRNYNILVGAADRNLWLWDAETGACKVFSGHLEGITCGGFTPDGKLICSGAADGTVKIWNPSSGKVILTIQGGLFHEAGAAVTCMSFHPSQMLMLTGGIDGQAFLVNTSNGKVLGKLDANKDAESVQSIEGVGFSNVLNMCATAFLDGKIYIWDVSSRQLRATLTHDEGVVGLRFHASKPILYTWSNDKTVRVWDIRDGKCLQVFRGHSGAVLACSISKDGNTIVTGGDDGACLVFKMPQAL
jgi:ribosome assembly protein SQT1